MDESKIFYCSGCGGIMEYNISSGEMKCPNCGNEAHIPEDGREIREHDFFLEADSGNTAKWDRGVSVVKCQGCGAEIVVEKDITSVMCGYCGSSHVLESKQLAGIPPEAILPFGIDKAQAGENFRRWIKKRWFAPNALKTIYQQDRLQALYIPYWTYDAKASGSFTGEGGEVYYVEVRRGDQKVSERRVRWYNVSGHVSRAFDDILVSAKSEQDRLTEKIGIYNTADLKPFSNIYLSGFQAEKYSLSPRQGFETAKNIMHNQLENDARSQILSRYDEARGIQVYADYSDVKFKHVLFPIWSSGYMYNNKQYRYVVNGQSGRVAGSRPYSKAKITVAAAIALILAVLIIIFISVNSDESGDYSDSNAYGYYNIAMAAEEPEYPREPFFISKGGNAYASVFQEQPPGFLRTSHASDRGTWESGEKV